jgi:hypothetical protein
MNTRRFVARLALAFVIVIATCGLPAYAVTAPAVTLSDGSRTATIDSTGTVAFGGACIVPTTCSTTIVAASPGQVLWGGKLGAFTIAAIVGLTKPALAPPATMDLSLQSVRTTDTGGTLTIQWSDTNFTTLGVTSIKMIAGGLIIGTGSVTLSAYADNTNALFGKGITVGTLGPFAGPTVEGTLTGPGPTNTPFSLTEQAAITLGANSSVGLDFEIDLATSPTTQLSCRMTGGGVDTNFNWDHTLADGEMVTNGAGKLPSGIDRYTYGGQVGAPTAAQPQPSGEWEHHQQLGPSGSFGFHAGTASAAPGTRIVEVRCSDPGFCNPARHAPNKQLDWDGIGTFSNLGSGAKAPHFQIPNANVVPEPNGGSNKLFTFHWVQVNIDDMGERGSLNTGAPDPKICPGRGFGEKSAGPFVPDPVNNPGTVVNLPATLLGNCDCPDFYRITIYDGVLSNAVKYLADGRIDPTSLDRTNVIYEVYGYVDGGNLQIHPPTGSN